MIYQLLLIIFIALPAFAQEELAEQLFTHAKYIHPTIVSFPNSDNQRDEVVNILFANQEILHKKSYSVEEVILKYLKKNSTYVNKRLAGQLKAAASIFAVLNSSKVQKHQLLKIALNTHVTEGFSSEFIQLLPLTDKNKNRLFAAMRRSKISYDNALKSIVKEQFKSISILASLNHNSAFHIIDTAVQNKYYNQTLLNVAAKNLHNTNVSSKLKGLSAYYLESYSPFPANSNRFDLPNKIAELVASAPQDSWLYSKNDRVEPIPIYKAPLLNAELNPKSYREEHLQLQQQFSEFQEIVNDHAGNFGLIKDFITKNHPLEKTTLARIQEYLILRPNHIYEFSKLYFNNTSLPVNYLGLRKFSSAQQTNEDLKKPRHKRDSVNRAEFDQLMKNKKYSLAMMLLLIGATEAGKRDTDMKRTSFYITFYDIIDRWISIPLATSSPLDAAKKAIAIFATEELKVGTSGAIDEIMLFHEKDNRFAKFYSAPEARHIKDSALATRRLILRTKYSSEEVKTPFFLIQSFNCLSVFSAQ